MTVTMISRRYGNHGDTEAQFPCDQLGFRYFNNNLVRGLAAT